MKFILQGPFSEADLESDIEMLLKWLKELFLMSSVL